MIKVYDPSKDELVELTQEKFDEIENMSISDSKRKALIKLIVNLSRTEFDSKFNKMYDMLVLPPDNLHPSYTR